jgi:hypothetical protein
MRNKMVYANKVGMTMHNEEKDNDRKKERLATKKSYINAYHQCTIQTRKQT